MPNIPRNEISSFLHFENSEIFFSLRRGWRVARWGFSRNWKKRKKHTPLTSPSPSPLFCFPPPASPVRPQASTMIAKRAPVPVSQPHILSRSSTIWRRPRSWSTRARSRVRIWKMSREALRWKENSRWAPGMVV